MSVSLRVGQEGQGVVSLSPNHFRGRKLNSLGPHELEDGLLLYSSSESLLKPRPGVLLSTHGSKPPSVLPQGTSEESRGCCPCPSEGFRVRRRVIKCGPVKWT